MAALLPTHWHLRVLDENVQSLTDEDIGWADLVLTGGMLPQQTRILEIIERTHALGKPVVVGGVDPTTQPSIYAAADYLVLGEGEVIVPHFLDDLKNGATSGIYQADSHTDLSQRAVIPRFDLVCFEDYLRVDVQFSRGCPYHCEFCAVVELFGRRPRSKTPGQIISEFQSLYDLGYRGHINILDDNFLGSKIKAMEMLRAVKEWSAERGYPFFFSTDASINLSKDADFLSLMRDNDFRYIFLGIETPDEDVLIQTHKKHNTGISIIEAVKTFADYGMVVVGGFILGFDSESKSTARNMIDVIQESGICMAYTGMLVALPNTQLFRRLYEEGRLYGEPTMRVADMQGDHTTNGLNFATIRPRQEVLQDYIGILQELYDPVNFYKRIERTVKQLRPNYKYRLTLDTFRKNALAFGKVSLHAGFDKQTALLYWKVLLRTLVTKPRAANFVVMMAAIYVHFSKRVVAILPVLEGRIDHIRSIGEEFYNQSLIGKKTELA